MLRQAAQGARWYQYVARRSPSILPHALPQACPVIARRCVHFGGPNDKVNVFEQNTRRSKTRRRVDLEEEGVFGQEELEDELSNIKKEMKILEEGPFGPNSEFMRRLPEKDREIALEALRKNAEQKGKQEESDGGLEQVFDNELDEMLQKEFGGMVEDQENWYKLRQLEGPENPVARPSYEVLLPDEETHAYVDKFNERLRQYARDKSDEPLKQDLWRWYRRCKQAVSGFLDILPEEAKSMVWDSQTECQIASDLRAAHLQTLVNDAMATGIAPSTPQTLSYIESLHEGGKTSQALDEWETHQTELSQQKEDLEAYWKLGVQIFAADDNPQRAQDIALAFLANDKSRNPRILNPVIVAWGQQPGKEAEVKAWALYLQRKIFLGTDMTMEDYDHISIGFLKAGRLGLAIAVFKDMMVTGRYPASDSAALYQAAVGLAGNLHESGVSEQDVNKVSLSALTLLPRQFQNRFFYASWMKKLIGMGEVDSAALVIELMYERGVKPDPKHLNGLIAGWFREGDGPSRKKAEHLGWAMIQQRIDLVWSRMNASGSAPRVSVDQAQTDDTPTRIPKWMQRKVPQGNIETFSILLLHYTRRADEDMINYLADCLDDAQIRPNAYFMNHLLYAELRKQDVRELWTKFQTMSTTIQPDLETYACLWDCGKLQFDRGRTSFSADFPSARVLLSNMITWYTQLPARTASTFQEEFSKDLYDQIIRCFCLSKDLPGTLIALHVLQATFHFYPDETTARLVILQVARLAGVPPNTPKRRLRHLSSTPRSKENINQIHRLVEILSERQTIALGDRGLAVSTLDAHERDECQLEIVSDLIRIIMGRIAGDADPKRVEEKIARAARDMGIADNVRLGRPLGEESTLLI